MLQKLTLLAAAGLFAVSMTNAFAQSPGSASGGWAVVAADGTVRSHANVKKVTHNEIGIYKVRFNQRVSGCAATATIGGAGKTVLPGYIAVSKRDDVISVHTFAAATLLPADFKFNLNVNCS